MTDTLRSIAHDLMTAPAEVQLASGAIIEHSAHNIKNDWARNARASSGSYAPAYPSSISYDLTVEGLNPGAEIGPDKAKPQGPLGNILEFGSVNNPPHNDGGRALDEEAPDLEHEIAAVALEALGWR